MIPVRFTRQTCLALALAAGAGSALLGLAQQQPAEHTPEPTEPPLAARLVLDTSAPLVSDGVGLFFEGLAVTGPDGAVRYAEATDAIHAKAIALLGLADTAECREALGDALRILSEQRNPDGNVVLRAVLDLPAARQLAADHAAASQAAPEDPGGGPRPPTLAVGPSQPADEASLEELLRLSRENPQDAEVMLRLGLRYAATGRASEAVVYFQQAADAWGMDPRAAEARSSLAAVYFVQRRIADALKQYRFALQVDPTYALAHYGSGACYEALGETARARAEYTAFLTLQPDGPLADAARAAMARLSGGGGSEAGASDAP